MDATIAPTFDVRAEVTPTGTHPVPFPDRIKITQELLGALVDATRPGQAHLMQRILTILKLELLSSNLRLSDRQVPAVMAAVAELEHEAARTAPDPALFTSRAQVLVDLLSIG